MSAAGPNRPHPHRVRDCVGVAGFTIAVLLPTIAMPLGPDQSALACAARRILEGRPPYLDVTYLFPGSSLLYACALRLFGDAARSIHLLDVLFATLAAVLLYLLASHLFDRAGALAAGLAYSLMYVEVGYWNYAQTDAFLNPTLLLVLLCWLKAVDSSQARWTLTAGAALAVAALCRVSALAIVICLPIIAMASMTPYSARRLCGLAGGTIAGAGVTLGGVAGAAIWSGYNLQDFFMVWTVVVPNHVARHSGATDGFWLRGFLAGCDFLLVNGNTLLAVAAILGTMPLLLRLRRQQSAWMIPAYAVATLVMAAAQRRFSAYHWLPTIPPWCLLAACALSLRFEFARLEPMRRQRLQAAYLALSVLLFLLAERRQVLRYRDLIGLMTSPRWRANYDRQFHTRPPFIAFSAREERNAAEYVMMNSAPDDGLFVWGFAPGVYFLSKRDTPALWMYHVYFDVPALAASGRTSYVESVMLAAPPIVIIRRDQPPPPGTRWHDASADLDALPELRDFIQREYVRVEQFAYLEVHKRKPPEKR